MTKHVTKDTIRERLLKILPRNELNDLANDAGVERPWDAERKYLETRVFMAWNEDTFSEIMDWLQRAK